MRGRARGRKGRKDAREVDDGFRIRKVREEAEKKGRAFAPVRGIGRLVGSIGRLGSVRSTGPLKLRRLGFGRRLSEKSPQQSRAHPREVEAARRHEEVFEYGRGFEKKVNARKRQARPDAAARRDAEHARNGRRARGAHGRAGHEKKSGPGSIRARR